MKESDLKIDAGYSRHPGGQQVTVTTTAVRITHIPTGLTASCDIERSQMKNKAVCLAMIEYGLAELRWKETA